MLEVRFVISINASKDEDEDEDEDEEDETYREEEDYAGGFMPDTSEQVEASTEEISQPSFPNLKPLDQLLPSEVVHRDVIVVRSPNKLPPDPASEPVIQQRSLKEVDEVDELGEVEGGGFLPEQEPDTETMNSSRMAEAITNERMDIEPEHEGGGFLPDEEEGGGFLPEDEDTAGGGFIPDEMDAVAEQHPQQPTANEVNDTTVAGGSNLDPDVTSAEVAATISPPLPSAHGALLSDTPPQNVDSQPLSQKDPDQDPEPIPDTSRRSSIESETSLLSHDPDEEDAEPEWLLNSLG